MISGVKHCVEAYCSDVEETINMLIRNKCVYEKRKEKSLYKFGN